MTTPNIHHIFPKSYLIANGYEKDMYNKIANFVYLRDDVNKKVDDVAPRDYLSVVTKYDGSYNCDINDESELLKNFSENAIPNNIISYDASDYEDFLAERRTLMAKLVKKYYESL